MAWLYGITTAAVCVPQQWLGQRKQFRQHWSATEHHRTLPEPCDLVGQRVPPVLLALGDPLLAGTRTAAAAVAAVVCNGRERGPATRRRLHMVALQRGKSAMTWGCNGHKTRRTVKPH